MCVFFLTLHNFRAARSRDGRVLCSPDFDFEAQKLCRLGG